MFPVNFVITVIDVRCKGYELFGKKMNSHLLVFDAQQQFWNGILYLIYSIEE